MTQGTCFASNQSYFKCPSITYSLFKGLVTSEYRTRNSSWAQLEWLPFPWKIFFHIKPVWSLGSGIKYVYGKGGGSTIQKKKNPKFLKTCLLAFTGLKTHLLKNSWTKMLNSSEHRVKKNNLLWNNHYYWHVTDNGFILWIHAIALFQ